MSFLIRIVTISTAATLLTAATASPVERLIRERVDSRRNVGIVVGIIDSTGRQQLFQYGSTAGDGSAPVGVSTVFEIGSITKTFTASLLADMVARGEVELDDAVSSYLSPDVHLASHGREISLLDLATQSSGLPGMPGNFHPKDADDPYSDYGPAQLYGFLSSYTPPRDPGLTYEYSNLGVGLLGHALGRRAGMTYERLLEERILLPLGMSDTHITLTREMRKRLAVGHNRDGDSVPNWHFDALEGAGALYSTVRDMMKFLAANLNSGSTVIDIPLRATQQSRRPTTIANTTIGLAWHILHAHGSDIIWHNGETAGYHSFIGFDVSRHVGVVVLSNSATSIDDLGFHLVDERNELRPPPAPPQELAQDTAMLVRYAGVYELTPGLRMTVTRSQGKLYAQVSCQQRLRLFASTDSTYRWTAVDAQLTFRRDGSGAATSAVLHQGGRDMLMTRVP